MTRTNVGQRRHNMAKREDKREKAIFTEYSPLSVAEVRAFRQIQGELNRFGLALPCNNSQDVNERCGRQIRSLIIRAKSVRLTLAEYIQAAVVCHRLTNTPSPTWNYICGPWVFEAIKKDEHTSLLNGPATGIRRQELTSAHEVYLQTVHVDINQLCLEIAQAYMRVRNLGVTDCGLIEIIKYQRVTSVPTLMIDPALWLLRNRVRLHPMLLFLSRNVIDIWQNGGKRFNGYTYAEGLLIAQMGLRWLAEGGVNTSALQRCMENFRILFHNTINLK